MRFPWASRVKYRIAAFAILNAGALVLLLLSLSAASVYKPILIILASMFFILWNIIFYREIYKQIQTDRKVKELLKLNDAYKHQIDDLRARQHDLKNQLTVIQEMLDRSPPHNKGVDEFIQCTDERVQELSMLLKLNNSAVGMLLYNKFKLACEKGIQLTVKSYTADLQLAHGQLYDLTAILGNIIDNAIESSAAGDKISVEIGEIQAFIYFSVINHGNLPAQDIGRLFSPGFSTKGDGRGFGLSNVRSAVLKHGGNIELTAEGDTVECRVYFPISA